MLLCSFFRRITETKINQLEMNEDVVMRDLSVLLQLPGGHGFMLL